MTLRRPMRCTIAAVHARLLALLAVALLLTTACRQPSAPKQTFAQPSLSSVGHDSVAPKSPTVPTPASLLRQLTPKGTPDKLLTRTAYTTSYNYATRCPNWVAWTLTSGHTKGRLERTNERFEEDTDVRTPRSTYQDFYSSGQDRGHMCPAGDNKWDQKALTETFLLTNICPQNHTLNKDDWNELEKQCRTWARRFGEVTIVCGPTFTEAAERTIGRNRVRVPDGFFKVVYRAQPTPAAVAFLFVNDDSPQPWREQLTTVDAVEALTGINFFASLPDDVEQRVEATADLQSW